MLWMGKFTIFMAIFNSKLLVCQRVPRSSSIDNWWDTIFNSYVNVYQRVHQFLSWLFRVTSGLGTSHKAPWRTLEVVETFASQLSRDFLCILWSQIGEWSQWLGLRENLNQKTRETIDFPMKYVVICPVKTNPLMFGIPGKLTDQPMFQSEIWPSHLL